jgi:hypothetical protein
MQNIKVIVIAALLVCVLLAGGVWALFNWWESSSFGRVILSMGDGSKVYVVRESWGLHTDQISVTQNSDCCRPPNPASDYIDTYGDGHKLTYSVSGNELTIYDEAGRVGIHEPSRSWSHVKVVLKKTRALGDMLANPRNYGVTILEVPLNEVCWINFIRKAGTSLRNGR